MVREISPKDLKARLDAGETIDIIDVREAWELQQSSLEGAIHIPMNSIPQSLDRIPKDRPVVIMCHMGSRSATVVNWMQQRGFDNLYSLEGGIDLWSTDVDPSVPMY